MKVLIVAVNYNSYEQLHVFIESVRICIRNCKSNVDVEIVVADNSIQKEKINKPREDELRLEVVPLDNLGYFGGAQYILNKIENKSQYDYIAVSNVDLKLNEDFLEKLSHYSCSVDIGWIAPSIYSLQENRSKKTIFRPSKCKFKLLCLLFKYPIFYKIYISTFYRRKRESIELMEEGVIYAGHGAFFLLTREFFKRNPFLDYKPFLFCEENFIAELLRQSSLKCVYVPSLVVWDDEHISTGKLNYKKMCKYNYEAHKFIYDRFYC